MNQFKTSIIAATLAGVAVLSGCSSTEVISTGIDNEMVSQSQDKPDWATRFKYKDDGHVYFVGISNRTTSERSAKESSHTNALAQAAKHFNAIAEQNNVERSVFTGVQENQINSMRIKGYHESKVTSKHVIQNHSIEDTYVETWENKQGMVFYKFYLLIKVPESTVGATTDEGKAN